MNSTPRSLLLGRHVYGLAAIGFGAIMLTWHDFNLWEQIAPLGNVAHRDLFADAVGVIQIGGGLAVQWRATARPGAMALAIINLFFAVLWLPLFLSQQPLVFDRLANFFEQFSLVAGALIVYATCGPATPASARLARFGYYAFGVCVISFTLDQAFYLHGTARLVPRWLAPSQMFWAVATTLAFALAAIALLSGRAALLAARLTAAMIAIFGLLVWLPVPFAHPTILTAWAGNAENWAIAGAAWIVADWLGSSTRLRP